MAVSRVHFQGLKLERRLETYSSPDGKAVSKWVPYGMPRLDNDILWSCFYLYRKNPRTGEIEGPCGSGVFVARRPEDVIQKAHVYAVTSYHVAITAGASIIRLNTWDAAASKLGHRFVEYGPEEWSFIPEGDDVAAIDVTDALDFDGPSHLECVWEDDFVTMQFTHDVFLGPGEDGFMLGLFTKSPGTKYNMPTTRFGNIAQVANHDHPIEQGNGVRRPSHIFDIRSRPGFSGSPVYVYRTPSNSLQNINVSPHWNVDTRNNLFLKLLGIHSGQFDDLLEARVAEAYGKNPIIEGDNIAIPSSMTIIVPAWAISELLDIPELTEQRKMREQKNARDGKPKVRPESVEPSTPSASGNPTDENPTHREDFMRLADAAARKQKQDE